MQNFKSFQSQREKQGQGQPQQNQLTGLGFSQQYPAQNQYQPQPPAQNQYHQQPYQQYPGQQPAFGQGMPYQNNAINPAPAMMNPMQPINNALTAMNNSMASMPPAMNMPATIPGMPPMPNPIPAMANPMAQMPYNPNPSGMNGMSGMPLQQLPKQQYSAYPEYNPQSNVLNKSYQNDAMVGWNEPPDTNAKNNIKLDVNDPETKIVEMTTVILDRIKQRGGNERMIQDTEKRIEYLYERLAQKALSNFIIAQTYQITKMVYEGDGNAKQACVEFMGKCGEETRWVLGLKRLCELTG